VAALVGVRQRRQQAQPAVLRVAAVVLDHDAAVAAAGAAAVAAEGVVAAVAVPCLSPK
jgi:hypothetical protein